MGSCVPASRLSYNPFHKPQGLPSTHQLFARTYFGHIPRVISSCESLSVYVMYTPAGCPPAAPMGSLPPGTRKWHCQELDMCWSKLSAIVILNPSLRGRNSGAEDGGASTSPSAVTAGKSLPSLRPWFLYTWTSPAQKWSPATSHDRLFRSTSRPCNLKWAVR